MIVDAYRVHGVMHITVDSRAPSPTRYTASHEIVVAPILLLLKPLFIKHAIITARLFLFFPFLSLLIFRQLLSDST